MTYNPTEHPRAPKGTPQGGQFTQKTGVGIDDDLPSISPYDQYSNEALIELLNTPEAHNERYDDMRTELCRRAMATQIYRNMSYEELYGNIQTPDGGGTFSPMYNISPTVGFCVSPYEQFSETLTLPSNAEQFQNEILEYYNRHQDILRQENTYIGLWHAPSSGVIFFDISTVNYDAQEARDACKRHDQKRFFDLQTGSSVIVNENATSGQGVHDE